MIIRTTLVSTVFNEAKRIDQTISDLMQQTCQPSEIIITDAGSTDGTYERLLRWKESSSVPIVVLRKVKCNVAEGRNMAIREAKYNIIVSTDFGCRFHPNWFESLTSPFANACVNVVSGAYTVLEKDQITLAAKAAYILSNGYKSDVNDARFIPSSRSIAYKKEVFDKVGGYCEWLTLAADDLVFGKEILAKGYQLYPVDKPYVYWIRHATAKGFVKEAGRYGLGDGEARVNLRNLFSNLISMIFRICFVVFALLFFVFTFLFNYSPILLLGLLLFILGFRSYFSYTKNWLKLKSPKYNFTVFLYGIYLMEATQLEYIKTYFRGYFVSNTVQKGEAKLLKERLLKFT